MKEPWIAHDHPERKFDAWTWLDDCEVCLEALKREAEKRPGLVFCLKTSADRVWVTAELLYRTLSLGEALETLCYEEGDWVREVFVVWGSLPPSISWRSLTLMEETTAELAASRA